MEQSVECEVVGVQATCGDNDVVGMSVITVESTSLASVHSDNSSIDEVVDYDDMFAVDEVNADVEDVDSSEKDAAVQKSREESADADVQESSEKFCASEVNGTEVTSQCDSSFCKTSAPENIEENSDSTEDMPFISIKGSSEKCDYGMEVASEDNATLKSAGLPELVPSVTASKKSSKKSLSELHKELLKRAEGLSITTPAEHRADYEDGEDSPLYVENHSALSASAMKEDSCIDTDLDGSSNMESSAGMSNMHGRCERSKSRKATKPVKRDLAIELVEIRPAQTLLAACISCSYTCVCKTQLDVHVAEVHQSARDLDHNLEPYECQLCPWFGSTKEVFERHMAHHPGHHIVRYHTCPYCLFCTTDMSVVESHLPFTHPGESFRFEVLQEGVSYQQKLVECPVCQGLYQWQQDLLCHFRECHNLELLASYVESAFSEQSELSTMSVPKELFNDLLDRYAAGVVGDDKGDGLVSIDSVEESVSPWTVNTVPLTQHQAPDVGTVIRFHCSSCDFNSEDFDLFKKHCTSHSAATVSNEDYSSPSSIPVKSGIHNTYHCHLCPFECSKMVHYRRHLEIHERNQSLVEGFRCGYCHFAHYRQNCVKFHLGKYHGDRPIKMSRITDGVEVELSETDLYALRSRRGPSDVRSHQSSPSTSVLVLRSEKEKRQTNRYESDRSVPLLRTSSARKTQQSAAERSPAVSDQSWGGLAELEEANRLLDEFEQDLPASMIYPDPVKCPRCDFTNRVRVNMIRHLKLHRDEDSALFGMSNPQPGNAAGHFDVQKNGLLDSRGNNEKPLLRRILSEKPLVSKSEAGSSFDSIEGNEESEKVVQLEVPQERVSQSTPQDYSEFCAKLPDTDLFQCHRCHFMHRFPSKMKRHYHYRHSSVMPYRCGHCPFEAVERGKVVKHWQVMHRSLPMSIIQQESGAAVADVSSTPVAGNMSSSVNDSKSDVSIANELPDMNLNLSDIVKQEPIDFDCEAPALDYYPITDNTSALSEDQTTRLSPDVDKSAVIAAVQPSLELENGSDQLGSGRGSRMCRRQFQCAYCGVISRWNRRDICLHVMHVHLQRRIFTCRYCSFGNSKSKMLVRAHCVKFHPNRVVSVRDDTSIANAITAVDETDGVVTVAFAPNGSPILDTDKLQEYLARNKLTAMPLSVNKNKSAATSTKTKPIEQSSPVSEGHKHYLRPRSADKEPVIKQPPAVEANTSATKARWKCRLCGFANERVGRVKYHIICRHLNLKPFSCPHCHLYLWKAQAVESHIDRCHPGLERRVIATVDEMSSYLKRNVEPKVSEVASSRRSPAVPAKPTVTTPTGSAVISLSSNKPTYFRCRLCGFQDVRNDKTKYHIVKQHLKLRQFSCPYCHLYLWGRQQVARHVEEKHPGFEVRIQRTFQEYEQFLRNNVCKVEVAGNSTAPQQPGPLSPSASVSGDQLVAYQRSTTLVARLPCDLCSFVTDSEMSLSAHRRSHRLYQCMHCRFRHTLVAKVQSHCLSMHPTQPVQYKQWTPSSLSSPTSGHNDLVSIKDEVSDCLKFYPCDFCPSHFSTQSALDGHLTSVHDQVYNCQLCGLKVSSRKDLETHAHEEHPGEPILIDIVPSENCNRQDGNRLPVKRPSDRSKDDHDDGDQDAKRQKLDTTTASDSSLSLYKCRLCPYSCHKVTVMRHHVMSHLRYHPYMCPYCNVLRSVKSFPVKKHIRLKHPGKEERFLFVQNKVLENKVEKSFYHVPAQTVPVNGSGDCRYIHSGCDNDGNDSDEQPPQLEREVEPVKLTIGLSSAQIGQHKVLYRCMMCGLKTHIRMDMRHHLMREIQYKPFKCVHCPYTEPCRWSMRKHFRTKHIGLDVAVTDMRDPEQDKRIERMLEECTIPLTDVSVNDLMAWKPRISSPQSGVANRTSEDSSSAVSEHPASLVQEISPVGVISLSSMALKLHRCPHCLYTNSNLKLLRSHMVKHGPCRLQCAYCDHRGHYPSRIYKHIRRHHPGRSFRVVKVRTEEEPEKLPPIDVQPRAYKPSKPSPGQVFLDGVAIDISLNADDSGWFRCNECGYQSMNREHYKMHVVIHRPPKWQCFYCDQKYPLIFRLRRHSNQKHPHLPIKWIDLSTSEVCFDPQKLPSSSADSSSSIMETTNAAAAQSPVRKPTARKSTTGRRMMQVALFRSAKFGVRQRGNDGTSTDEHSPDDVIDSDSDAEMNGRLKIVEDDDEVDVMDNDDNNDVDKEIEINDDSAAEDDSEVISHSSAVYIDYDCDVSDTTYVHNNILRFRCHLCSFTVLAQSTSAFAEHLNREHHSDICRLPAVEILDFDSDTNDGTAPMLLRRCGFCSFESYVGNEFDDHVLSTHRLPRPLRCNLGCMYASFSRLQMHAHFAETHSRETFRVSPLDKPYSMLPYEEDSAEDNDDIFVTFSPKVTLEDVFEWSDSRFEALLNAHGVWY